MNCRDQREVDYYWDRLLAGGGAPAQCGWLKDRFGFSWQVVPTALIEMLKDSDAAAAQRAMAAMMQMIKLDVDVARRAFEQA